MDGVALAQVSVVEMDAVVAVVAVVVAAVAGGWVSVAAVAVAAVALPAPGSAFVADSVENWTASGPKRHPAPASPHEAYQALVPCKDLGFEHIPSQHHWRCSWCCTTIHRLGSIERRWSHWYRGSSASAH
jgi:hypothetical protein